MAYIDNKRDISNSLKINRPSTIIKYICKTKSCKNILIINMLIYHYISTILEKNMLIILINIWIIFFIL